MPRPLFQPILLLWLLAPAARAASTPAADEAYQDAKGAYARLKADDGRRKFRHHWLNVARKFDRVGSRWSKSDRAPEALFNAGELYSELSRFSQQVDDLQAAEAAYRALVDGWPRHRLGDDAAFALARLLADRRDAPAAAVKVIQAALERGAGDRKADLQKLLGSLPKPAARAAVGEASRKAGRPNEAVTPNTAGKIEGAAVTKAAGEANRAALTDGAPVAEGAPPAEAAERASRAAKPDAAGPAVVPTRPIVARPAPEEDEPPLVPDEASGAGGTELLKLPTLSSLQERLRDVRVGARPLPAQDAVLARRLKQTARDGRGAEFTLAEQLGLKMRRVVIDPGHGGHDTGAIGPTGVLEKDVALAISLQVAASLEAAGLEVVLTRADDTFVRLEDRATFANQHKGDLFLSIHCNAGPSKKMRGIETYTLNTSANRYSIRLAARENATSERGVSDLQFILADLATKANTEESSRLAQRVQQSLVRKLGAAHEGIKDLGTKEALFYVLLGAKMPAILVETSFLSHPEEEKLLGDEKYQSLVAAAISAAVTGFLEEREAKLARID